MTSQLQYLTDYRVFDIPEKVVLGDGLVVEALGIGTVRLKMVFTVSNQTITKHNLFLYVKHAIVSQILPTVRSCDWRLLSPPVVYSML